MNRQTEPKALRIFKEAASMLYNSELKAYKENGGKVVGYFYPDIPEEIITAAGAVPFCLRGTGAEGTDFADKYFRQLTCDYTKTTFNEILEDKYDFLDGAVVYNNCDHLRRIYDNWLTLPENPCYAFIYVPKKRGTGVEFDRYRKEINTFKEKTEKHFGVEITDEKLKAAIALHNETRALQREFYELKKQYALPVTGAETLAVMMAGASMPRDRYNVLLRELIDELKVAKDTIMPKKRLMYVGGHADDVRFMEALESQGGIIVTDDTGFGTKAIEGEVSLEGDPMEAISRYYFLEKAAAPRTNQTVDQRMERIGRMINEYNVDGVISSRLFMCDQWAFEQFILADYLKEINVPGLNLEANYVFDGAGQIQTRVQAFIESMRTKAKEEN